MKLCPAILILLISHALSRQLAPRTISDAIHFLCTIEHYEEASELYRDQYGQEMEVNYLDRRTCMEMFSAVGDSGMYDKALKDYLKLGGETKYILRLTDENFYQLHKKRIAQTVEDVGSVDEDSEEANETIRTFREHDQTLRRMWSVQQLSRDDFIYQDSVNQIAIKALIASRELNDYRIGQAIFLLLRHATADYLEIYRTSGLLEHYAQRGLISYEEYYDAVGYITGTYYFTDPMVTGQDVTAIEARRQKAGLLPLKYSPVKSALRNLRRDIPERTPEQKRSLAEGLLKYLEDRQ